MGNSLMDEGLDKDDKFRMVEDEFLDAAKRFTQHLHAAEYQRLKKAVRSQNAAAISSISRPVTIRMPDETRRKVESVARAKRQATAVQRVLGNQSHGSRSDEDSDAHTSAWLGTALHGLMESPRRSAASLTEIRKNAASTRAAVGFDKLRSQKTLYRSLSLSPPPEPFGLPNKKAGSWDQVSNESGDDDLNAPIRSRMQLKPVEPTRLTVRSGYSALQQDSNENLSKTATEVSLKTSSTGVLEDGLGIASHVSISARERVAKRLEQAKLQQAKEEQGSQKKQDIIPLFLL